ncbi:OmpA family protein [Luteolibacter marinus]|uniref:OmpA family protein n=1 Tax=Luteolibacter marinus TaxID=2776705 RepID=UPI00186952A1
MDEGYSWRDMRESTPLRLPGPDNLGWWAGVAFFVAVILHVAAFFALGHIKIALGIQDLEELETESINLEQVEVLPPDYEMQAPEEIDQTPPDTAALLEEIDILAKLPEDTEIDLRPDLNDPEFAIKLDNPAMEGEPAGITIDPAAGFDLDTALPDIGRTEEPLPLAADSQTIVDPGAALADDSNLDQFAEEILKKGAGGKVEAGTLDGMVTLDDMVGLPADVLVGKMTMLPSDLLFEYDSAELRESARLGMMKLALIIDRNPNLYCWIEGHTDLFGADAYNQNLSKRRAAAVKDYLTGTLHLQDDKIATRGFGSTVPLVKTGSVEEQAPNRRVEIRMRRTPPPAGEPVVVKPKPAPPAPPEEKPVLVKPMRALPVEDPPAPTGENAPRARPVETEPAPPKAQPIEEDPPRATEIEEPALRAVPVE